MEFDKDLCSVQEVRNLISKAQSALEEYAEFGQERIDQIVKAVAEAGAANAEHLAKMAVEETGFGVWQDKVLKNLLGSTITYDYIKDMKTVGILREDPEKKLMEIAVPVGIIAALIPSTNPTSTVMYQDADFLEGRQRHYSQPPSRREEQHPGDLQDPLSSCTLSRRTGRFDSVHLYPYAGSYERPAERPPCGHDSGHRR